VYREYFEEVCPPSDVKRSFVAGRKKEERREDCCERKKVGLGCRENISVAAFKTKTNSSAQLSNLKEALLQRRKALVNFLCIFMRR
jgi:hypothetical protein